MRWAVVMRLLSVVMPIFQPTAALMTSDFAWLFTGLHPRYAKLRLLTLSRPAARPFLAAFRLKVVQRRLFLKPQLGCRSSQLGSEVRVRNTNQFFGPLARGLAAQLSHTKLGDHIVDIVFAGADVRPWA